MKKIFLCFFLLMSLNSIGQVTTGCFHIGGPEFEFVKAMVVTYDGNYVIGGLTYSYSSVYYDENFYVVKTDPSGNVLWSHSVGDGFLDVCWDLIETSDHSIVAVGSANSGYLMVVKYDENGNQQWLKTIDILNEFLIYPILYAVVETEDGGFLMGGSVEAYRSYMVKLDSNGDKEWEKLFYNADNPFGGDVVIYALERTAEDHYIAGCWTLAIPNVHGPAAFDKNGNFLWAKQSIDGGIVYNLAATADSGFVTAGASCFASCNAELCKFDKEGNLEWSRAYGDTLWDAFNAVAVTTDGGYIAAGIAQNFEFPPDNLLFGYIVKTDSVGNMEWSHIIGDPILNRAQFNDVHQTSDGGYVAAGTGSYGAANFFIAKFDADGNICPECLPAEYGSELTGTDFTDITMEFETDTGILDAPVYAEFTGGDLAVLCLETGVENIHENFSISVFPNPSASGIFEVSIPAGISNATIKVCDVTEKMLLSKKSNGNNNFIDLSDRASGVYFLFIEHGNQQFSAKLIK